MANEQKINEIISEAAFQQLDKLYNDLKKAADEYGRFGAAVLDVNKEISNSKSMSDLEKALEKQILAEEKIALAKARTQAAEERLSQAKLRTIEMAEKATKRQMDIEAKAASAAEIAAKKQLDIDAKSAAAAQRAIKDAANKEAAVKRMAANEKDAADSVYNANIKNLVSEKARQQALKASEAAAASFGNTVKKQSEQEAELRQKQSISFKGAIQSIGSSGEALSSYGVEVDGLIQKQLRLRSTLKLLQSEFKDLGADASEQQIRDFALSSEKYKLAISQTGTEIKRLVKEQTSAEGSYDRMDARLNTLRATYKKLTPEQKKTEQSAKDLAAEIAILDTELKKADAELGVHNRNVGNYESALDGLEDQLNAVNPTLGGFVGQLKQAYVAAMAFIATPIGAAIAAIAAVAGGAKAWYDYNQGLTEATRLTQQFTDLQGDDLIHVRSQVEAIADVYDKDFREVLVAVNATAKNFGISFSESIELVKNGFISGADASNDFLNQLREYPTQLESVGLSADQTIALISQNVKDGIFSDKGIDAIKEGGLSIREMTKATSDALKGIGLDSTQIQKDLISGNTTVFKVIQDISSRLSELPPQSAVVGTAIADIFRGPGEDAGLRYLTTIKDIDLNLNNLVEQQGRLGEAQRLQIEATETLKMEFASLFDQTGGGFELLIANGKLLATNVLVDIIRGVMGVYNWFARLYNSSQALRGGIQLIGITFKQVYNAAKLLFETLFNGFSTAASAIEALINRDFNGVVDAVKNGYKKSAKSFKDFGTDLGNSFSDGFRETIAGNISEIDNTLNVGGAVDVAQGVDYGGNKTPLGKPDPNAEKQRKSNQRAQYKADRIAEKNKKELEKTLLDLTVERLKAEENAIKRSADSSKEIASDDGNGYDDRLFNLQNYLRKSEDLIVKSQEKQKKENAKYLIEASAMDRAGRTADAEALRELALTKNKEIDEAVNDQRIELTKEGNKILLDIYTDDVDNRINQAYESLETQADEALVNLAKKYAEGKLTEQQYADAREDISNNLTAELIRNEIRVTEAAILTAKAKGLDVGDLEKQLSALKVKYSKAAADKQISDIERVDEREKKAAEYRKELAQDFADLTFEILGRAIEGDLQKLDTDLENINKKSEAEKKAIENSTLSEEEKNARLFALEQKTQVQTEQIEAKKAQLKLRQAKLDRAQNILSIIGNTAAGIMKAFADLGPIAGIPFAAIIGAMGAAQLVSVISQPLPKYFKGTDHSKEGFAHVGERGTELMIEPNGKMLLTPDRDTVTYLQKGTKILTNEQTKKVMASRSLSGVENRPSVNRDFELNFSKLVDENKRHNSKIISAVKQKQYFGTVITKSGFTKQVFEGAKLENWKRKNGI